MSAKHEQPNTFLWVLRGLITVFLLGFLVSLFMAIFVADIYPSGYLLADLLGLVFILVLGFGYYLMWSRHETLSGMIFILWYAALWPADIFIGGDVFEDSPFPGLLLFILGLLLLLYRMGARKRLNSGQ